MIKGNAPKDYVCPICMGIKETNSQDTLMRQTDVIYRDDLVKGFINSFFIGKNAGHAIVVPNEHYENIYDIPPKVGHRIFEIAQKISLAMKAAYNCDGITIRQNNEPAGDQHAFHFHMHVIPRYENDGFNKVQPSEKRLANVEERAEYSAKLSRVLNKD